MKRRSFTFRFTIYSALTCLALIGASCATEDHVVPEAPAETLVQTNESEIFSFVGVNGILYHYEFLKLTAIPIVESGIVRVFADVNAQNVVPTITDTKVVYIDGPETNNRAVSESLGTLLVPHRIFYRAYAILENGKVVYGETKSRLNISDTPLEPTILTLDADVSLNNIKFGFDINVPGGVPITEYGILHSSGFTQNPPTPPTEADKKEIFTATLTLDPIYKTVSKGSGLFIYYQAYAKLLNGNTVYGEVKSVGTELN